MSGIMNYSLLNGNNFRFTIVKAPYLSFFAQTIDLPAITLSSAPTGTPFSSIPTPGDQITFSPLQVTFLVDEDLKGYLEIYNWIRGLGFPTTFEEYASLVYNEKFTSRWAETASDIEVVTATGSRNSNMLFSFIDAIPTSLTAPTLTTITSDIPTLTCTATFDYTYFNVKSVKLV